MLHTQTHNFCDYSDGGSTCTSNMFVSPVLKNEKTKRKKKILGPSNFKSKASLLLFIFKSIINENHLFPKFFYIELNKKTVLKIILSVLSRDFESLGVIQTLLL